MEEPSLAGGAKILAGKSKKRDLLLFRSGKVKNFPEDEAPEKSRNAILRVHWLTGQGRAELRR